MTVNGHSFDEFIHESMTSCLGVSKNPKHQLSGFKKRCDSLNSSGVALVLFLVLKKSSCSNTQYRNVPGQKSGNTACQEMKNIYSNKHCWGERQASLNSRSGIKQTFCIFKILKKSSIVQKKSYLIWKPLVFALINKIEKPNNQKQKTKQNVIFQLLQFSIFFDKNFMDWSLG